MECEEYSVYNSSDFLSSLGGVLSISIMLHGQTITCNVFSFWEVSHISKSFDVTYIQT